jgi:hypothetical protein
VSRIEGVDQFRRNLKKFEDDVAKSIDAAIAEEVLAMQAEAAALVPVVTGRGRDAILLPEAIKEEKSPDGPGKRIIFGFLTRKMRDMGFHLFFVEFGTKAYDAGSQRTSGVDKRGRQRFRRVKKPVPARAAQPFWRPAEANMYRRLQRRLDMARIVQAAKTAAGLSDKG